MKPCSSTEKWRKNNNDEYPSYVSNQLKRIRKETEKTQSEKSGNTAVLVELDWSNESGLAFAAQDAKAYLTTVDNVAHRASKVPYS